MAEIGLAASIIGIIGAGVKLSIATFDFAASIGSAGKELQEVATEVAHISSVLKHLQLLLDHAHFQPSSEAISDLKRIITHCHAVFHEIEDVVSGLRSSKGNEIFPTATPDFINKVKWTFKKSQVKMRLSSLNACKTTLSLMLNTMMLAESVSQTSPTVNVAEDEQSRAMTQSLVIAQQCAVEELEHFEDEVDKEEDTARRLPGLTTSSRAGINPRRKSKSRLVGMFSGLSVVTDLQTTFAPVQTPSRKDRASVWLDSIVAPSLGSVTPHPGTRRQKRLSSAGTANAPLQLLQRWTKTSEAPHDDPSNYHKVIVGDEPIDIWRESHFSFVKSDVQPPDEPAVGLSRASTGLVSPKTARMQSVSFCQTVRVHGALEYGASTSFAEDRGESYDSLTTELLYDFDASISHSQVELCIYYGGKYKVLKASEPPLQVFRQYEELDLDPRLVVRRSAMQFDRHEPTS